MRKILNPKFWSHGTSLGYLGPVFQGDVILGACQWQILVIWGLCEPPELMACQSHAENPKTAGV